MASPDSVQVEPTAGAQSSPGPEPSIREIWDEGFPGMTDGKQCPIRWMLDRVGERWNLYVLAYLAEHGPARFSAISSNLGAPISNRMLTSGTSAQGIDDEFVLGESLTSLSARPSRGRAGSTLGPAAKPRF